MYLFGKLSQSVVWLNKDDDACWTQEMFLPDFHMS